MSGCSYDRICPNCEGSMDCYSDHKPFDYVSGNCLECGFTFYTKTEQMTLEDLNERRAQRNDDNEYEPEDEDYLKPFDKLPEIHEDLV